MGQVEKHFLKIVQPIKGDDIYEKVFKNALGWIRNGRQTTLHDRQKIRISSINMDEGQFIRGDDIHEKVFRDTLV